MLTEAQMQLFATHIKANTDSVVHEALVIGDDRVIADWYNQVNGVTKAWRVEVPKQTLFEAMNLTTYDNLTAGKRDAWSLVMSMAPINATNANLRQGIVDIFGKTDSVAILNACLEYARNCELVFGTTSKTTNNVVGVVRDYVGEISLDDVSNSLNKYGRV